MTAGRKTTKQTEVIDVEAMIDAPKVANAMTVMRQDAQSEQQRILNDVLALGSDIGIVTLARIQQGISAVAEVKAFERMNKSKAFRYIEIPGPDGVPRLAENADEFFRAVFGGRGYKAMSDQKQMLDKLGEETYECATRLGLNRQQLRLLINLPEDTRAVVEEAMQASDKTEVVSIIQSLANQLDETKANEARLKAELTGEIEAKESLLAHKNKQIDELALLKAAPPDERMMALREALTRQMNDVRGAIRGKFTGAIEAMDIIYQEEGVPIDLALLAGALGEIQADITALRDRFAIPDIAPALIPEWVTDPNFGKTGD